MYRWKRCFKQNGYRHIRSVVIGNIKAANNECTIYLCNVVPRGDVDETAINSSIEKMADLWRLHQVETVKSTKELFFGSNGLPS